MNQNNSNFEVYMATDALGNLLYIGHGIEGRHKHCVSGRSHVYELNKMHFTGKVVEVDVILNSLSKEDSAAWEKKLIMHFRPAFNKDHNERKLWLRGIKKEFKKKWVGMKFKETGEIMEEEAETKVRDLLEFVADDLVIISGGIFYNQTNIQKFSGVVVFEQVDQHLWRILPEYIAPFDEKEFQDYILHLKNMSNLSKRIAELEKQLGIRSCI